MKDYPIIPLDQLVTSINGLWTGKKPPFKTVAVIRNTNFSKDCRLKMDDVAMIEVEERQFASRKLLVGDIIIEKSGGSDKQPVGRPVLFNIAKGEYSFSNFTGTLRVDDTSVILPEYLHKFLYFFYLSGKTVQMQSKTTGLRNLDFKTYLRIPVPVPSIKQQKQIVAELDLLNDIIDDKNIQLHDLDEFAQSIFFEMFGKQEYAHKKLIELCASQDDIKCGPFGTQLSKSEFQKTGVAVWGIPQINSNFVVKPTDYISEAKAQSLDSYSLIPGDIVMSRKGNIGQSAVFPDSFRPGVLHSDALRIRLRKDVANVHYYVYQFHLSPFIKHQLSLIGHGAIMPGLNVTKLKRIDVEVPPIKRQNEFGCRIIDIEKKKKEISESISAVKELLFSRMERYFTK